MILLDTNYLIRFFTNDIKSQAQVAKKLIEKSKEIYLSTIVIAETVFILRNHYQIGKNSVCQKLVSLIAQPNIKTQGFVLFALQIYEDENISFYDSLLVAEATEKNASLKTFDQKLSKVYSKCLD